MKHLKSNLSFHPIPLGKSQAIALHLKQEDGLPFELLINLIVELPLGKRKRGLGRLNVADPVPVKYIDSQKAFLFIYLFIWRGQEGREVG